MSVITTFFSYDWTSHKISLRNLCVWIAQLCEEAPSPSFHSVGFCFPVPSLWLTLRSLSRADLSIHFIWFYSRSRGLMTAKKELDSTLCLALLRISKSFLAFTSFFSNSLIRLFSFCTAVLYWFLNAWQVASRNGCRDMILSYMDAVCDLVNDKRSRSWHAFRQWFCISSIPFEAPSITFT